MRASQKLCNTWLRYTIYGWPHDHICNASDFQQVKLTDLQYFLHKLHDLAMPYSSWKSLGRYQHHKLHDIHSREPKGLWPMGLFGKLRMELRWSAALFSEVRRQYYPFHGRRQLVLQIKKQSFGYKHIHFQFSTLTCASNLSKNRCYSQVLIKGTVSLYNKLNTEKEREKL